MTNVCRLCLQGSQRSSKNFNINTVESFTSLNNYSDQLTTCIPEMALDLTPNPMICNVCCAALQFAYDFKYRCMLVEKKIWEYIESQPSHDVNYELSQISDSDLPPVPQSPLDEHPEEGSTVENPNESDLLLLHKEIILPATGEIEITNVTPQRRSVRKKMEAKEGPHACFVCNMSFVDVGKLLLHRAVHGDKFVCNFCHRRFKTLLYLRKHNKSCSKIKNTTKVSKIRAKKPPLPKRAKNQLKRWLFQHTDRPYPTEYDKQVLMQVTNLTLIQVENWFINARRRILEDLIKLKKHGMTCDDIHEEFLYSDIDTDEVPITQSSPSPAVSESETFSTCNIKIENEVTDIFLTPMEIISIKREIVDDEIVDDR